MSTFANFDLGHTVDLLVFDFVPEMHNLMHL